MIFLNNRNCFNSNDWSKTNLNELFEFVTTTTELLNLEKDDLPVLKVSANKINGLNDENVLQHSGYLHFDVDIKDNLEIDFDKLKAKLIKDKRICFIYSSFSGGLKFLVKTNIKDISQHKYYYRWYKGLFESRYDIKLDNRCANIGRLAYLYYDGEAYIYTNSEVLTLPNKLDEFFEMFPEDEPQKEKSFYNENDRVKSNEPQPQIIIADTEENQDLIISNLLEYYPQIFNEYRFPDPSIVKLKRLRIKLNTTPTYNKYTKINNRYMKDEKAYLSQGIEFCEINLKNLLILPKSRNKTLGSITMKLIFNNPLLSLKNIYNEVQRINSIHCTPPLTEAEVYNIVRHNYNKYLTGRLNFNCVVRTNKKGKSLKHTFSTQKVEIPLGMSKKQVMSKYYQENKRNETINKIYFAIEALQDNKTVITKKLIAERIGMSEDTVKRNWKEFKSIIESYNNNIKPLNKIKGGASLTLATI